MNLFSIEDEEKICDEVYRSTVPAMREIYTEAFRAGQEAMRAKVCDVIGKHYRGAKGLGGKTLLVQVKQDIRDIPLEQT